MSDQQETTTNTNEPRLCKMGCGFFGSNATGDCCSKCWGQTNAKKTSDKSSSPSSPTAPAVAKADEPTPTTEAEATVVPETKPAPKEAMASPSVEEPSATEQPTVKVTKKKKKKKANYKNMMAGMMKGEGNSRDINKEKEDLRKVTGGGAFTKVQKI